MPDALADVVRSRSGACLAGVASDDVVPCVVFEEPDCTREEAGGDEVEEAGADYQEDLELCCVATTGGPSAVVNLSDMTHGSSPIDQVPNRTTSPQTTDDSQRKRCSW